MQAASDRFRHELETLIRARYPILYIVTNEELRACEMILQTAQQRQKKVFEWSASTGIVPAGGVDPVPETAQRRHQRPAGGAGLGD